MSDSVYVGARSATLETSPAFDAISKIVIYVDDENVFEAGNDNGRTLELTCPYGTQAMANNLLDELGGYAYQPMQASDALMDPAAELGDAVTIGGVYTILASADTTFDELMAADIGAPGQEEIESEYPYTSRQQTEQQRQLAKARSEIAKNASSISLLVEGLNKADQSISKLEVSLGSISLSVTNGSTSSQIALTVDGVQVSSQNITMNGLVTYTGLSSGTTTINGACIKTGTIDADRLNLTGAISFSDLSASVQNDINDAYTMAEDAQTSVGEISSTVDNWSYRYNGRTYIDGTQIMAGTVTASTLRGGTVELLDNRGSTAGEISLSSASSASYAVDIDSYGAMRLQCNGNLYLTNGGASMTLSAAEDVAYFNCTVVPNGNDRYLLGTSPNRWADVYCQTGAFNGSDENIKNSIEELPEKYITFIDNVIPRRFKYDDGTSNRYHAGFTAQNVKAAMDAAGISDLEFAGWAKDVDAAGNDTYLLRYTEFLAPMLLKIRQQEERIANLENAIKELRQ